MKKSAQKLSRNRTILKFPSCRFVVALTMLFFYGSFSSALAGMMASAKSTAVCQNMAPTLELELSRLGVDFGNPIYVRIFKESNELELWVQGDDQYKLFKTYEICAFSGDLGPKLREGDRQSPEGFYYVTEDKLNPFSRFHLSFDIGFPNDYDKAMGRSGSALMVHGACVSVGCFAMTNRQMDEIYTLAEAALKNGQSSFSVDVFPFRMTAENMALHKRSPWMKFWRNLKEGYDLFERNSIPPVASVKNKKYVFEQKYAETAKNHRSHAQFSIN
ncbi:MAG: murein L,D-transpeptidase family protein [Pseudomonadota bacterium]